MNDLQSLRDQLRQFSSEREWDQFHSPKNLAMALSVEASELLEAFQWLTEEQSKGLAPEVKAEVGAEAADVLLYLVRLCDKLDIDLVACAHDKMRRNAEKYPVDKSRGNNKKYTQL